MFDFVKKGSCERIESLMERNVLTRLLLSHTCLVFFYGIFLFAYELKFLRELIPALHPVLIGWAGVLAAYDVLIRRVWRKLPFWQPLFLFAVSALVTAVLNRETGIVGNVKSWILTVLPLLAFLPVCILADREKREKTLMTALLGVAVVACLASAVSLVMYLNRVKQSVTFMGITDYIGFRYYDVGDPESAVLLYGIYTDTNHAAIYALALIAYSVMLLRWCVKGGYSRKWQNMLGGSFAVVNILVQSCYFPLANSRGAWLSLCAALLIPAFIYLYSQVVKKGSASCRCGISLLLACAVLGANCLFFFGTRTAMSTAAARLEQHRLEQTQPSVPEATAPSKLPVSSETPGTSEVPVATVPSVDPDAFEKDNAEFGAGRITIWKETVDLIRHKPIMGQGPGNISYYAAKYAPDGAIAAGKVDVHNSYLDLLLDYGIVGFVLLMGFWVLCVLRVCKRIFVEKRSFDLNFYLCAFVVFLTACGALLLSCTFVNTTVMYLLMLVATGYLMAECGTKKTRK